MGDVAFERVAAFQAQIDRFRFVMGCHGDRDFKLRQAPAFRRGDVILKSEFAGRYRQRNERVAAVVGGVLNRRVDAHVAEHRVDQQLKTVDRDKQRAIRTVPQSINLLVR